MTDPLALTKNDLLNLFCHKCKKFLSVPPIHLDSGTFICGRCDSSGNHITIYEDIAKRMTFPCIYEGCTIQLRWGQVKDHENNCPFKVLSCPKPNCYMYYRANDFHQHFLRNHKVLLHNQELKIKRSLRNIPMKNFNRDKGVYLILHDNQPYLLLVYGTCTPDRKDPRYIGSYNYDFGVFYLSKNDKTKTNYNLHVTITDVAGMDTNYSFQSQPVLEYKNDYCFGCLERNCYKRHSYKKPPVFLRNTTGNIKNNGIDYILQYSVNFVSNESTNASAVENASLASKFECPICYEYLMTPIFICANGHSVCSKCKLKIRKCALCKAFVGNSRNYTLEEIIDTLEICCPNATKGCVYSGKVKDTKEHMLSCQLNHSLVIS